MPKNQNEKEAQYVQALMKEALYLTTVMARMDKKIEEDLNAQSDKMANWIDENSLAKWFVEFGTDTAAQTALEEIFSAAFKLLKIATGPAGLIAEVTVEVFSSSGQPTKRGAYLDTRPEFASDYDKKKKRLQRIYAELFWFRPPSASRISPPDRCAQEACWRSTR